MESLTVKLTDFELARLFLRNRAKDLRQFLGMNEVDFRRLKAAKSLMTGMDYLKAAPLCHKTELLIELGSYKAMAKYFAVSESFVKNLFPSCKATPVPTKSQIESLLVRLGAPTPMAQILGVTVSELARLMDTYGLEKPRNFEFHSNAAHYFGRQAEVEYMKLRNLDTKCDMTHKDPNHPFDVLDPQYGRVNVKASKMFRYKSKRLDESEKDYHKFDLNGIYDCDHVALMMYDRKKQFKGCLIIKASDFRTRIQGQSPTFILNYQTQLLWMSLAVGSVYPS